jgi:hypothetical protein
MLIALGVVYFLMSWAPIWWPALAAYRGERSMPRRLLFVFAIACSSYGVFAFLFFALTLPAEMYAVFVAPQMEQLGHPASRPLLTVLRFLEQYWWLALPPVLFGTTFFITRKLSKRWVHICAALDG